MSKLEKIMRGVLLVLSSALMVLSCYCIIKSVDVVDMPETSNVPSMVATAPLPEFITLLSVAPPVSSDPPVVQETIVSPPPTSEPLEPEQEEVVLPVVPYTDEDIDLLARLIYSEGGTESYETKMRIGSVVLNRMADEAFPDNLYDVIYQKNQFSVTFLRDNNGTILIDRPANEESKEVALELLTYGSILPPKVQVFYNANYVESGWVTTREIYEVCDRTTFSYIYAKGENQ